MKYAIILDTNYSKYLLGFTNTAITVETTLVGKKYTVELKETNCLFLTLDRNDAIYF